MTGDLTDNRAGSPDSENLLRLAPRIFRARGWRLYAEGGERLVDLWQYGGRALLGHNPPGLLRAIKNSAERGLYAPFPHFAEGRFLKALTALFASPAAAPIAAPGQAAPRALSFRFYADEASLDRALAGADFAVDTGFTDGADETGGAARVCRWRPFLETPSAPVFVPVLPFPFPGAPLVLALGEAPESRFPPPDAVSPLALAAAARCVWDLIAAAPARSAPRFPKLDRALSQNRLWSRRGVYLTFSGKCDSVSDAAEVYAAVWKRFLEGGFLLPPSDACPAILPGELSPGEEAKLAALFRDTAS